MSPDESPVGSRMNSGTTVLGVRDLTVGYNGVPIVHDVSLELVAGTTACVVGPNGCGKSTLLKGLAGLVKPLVTGALDLASISNRSQKVWPEGNADVFYTDHWRCRFTAREGTTIAHADIVELLGNLARGGLDFTQTENLCNFDGKSGFSAA